MYNGSLAAALLEGFLARGWMHRVPGGRTVLPAPAGAFERYLATGELAAAG